MEHTKDYSKVYNEEAAPVPQTRRSTTLKTLDGAPIHRRHRELGMGIDPNALSSALYNLSAAQHKAYAITTLQQHYSAVFQKKNTTYKVYINYIEDGFKKGTYLVKIDKNNLRSVKHKLPIKGNFRLFFSRNGQEMEEIDDDDSTLPYIEKDGQQIIQCKVFRE